LLITLRSAFSAETVWLPYRTPTREHVLNGIKTHTIFDAAFQDHQTLLLWSPRKAHKVLVGRSFIASEDVGLVPVLQCALAHTTAKLCNLNAEFRHFELNVGTRSLEF